jgi:hypothetical protein
MFTCPSCESRTISLSAKFFATRKAPARCRRCAARLCPARQSKGRLAASVLVLGLLVMGAFRIKFPPLVGFLLLAVAIVLCLPALALPLQVAPLREISRLRGWTRAALKALAIVGAMTLLGFLAWNHL